MFRIDADWFRRCSVPPDRATAEHCFDLAQDAGGLARWLLRPETLGRAAAGWDDRNAAATRDAPVLRPNGGACWIVFAADGSKYPLLREAIVIPLRWRRGQAGWGHDLPPRLADLGRRVLDDVRAADSPAGHDWVLRLAVDDYPERYNLTGWGDDLGCGSGWASVAVGLVLAARGGLPDTRVWASAAWNDRPDPVSGLAAKLRAARAYGATTFFVADGQQLPAEIPAGLTIEHLPAHTARPLDALRLPLARLVARPVPDRADPARMAAFFQDARSYVYLHRRELRDDPTADAFYRDTLQPEIEARCRPQLPPGWFDRPRRLVTILSESPELAVLTAAIVRPASVLLLVSPKTERHLPDALSRLAALIPRGAIRTIRIADDTRPGRLAEEVGEAAAKFPADELVIDLTPGTKGMTVALWHHLAAPGRRMIFVQTQWGENRGELSFGTEEIVEVTSPI